jgi:hypothetical protein
MPSIRSATVEVEISPDRGCEVRQVTHCPSGQKVLLEFPALHDAGYGPSWEEWIAAYRGGWQLLLPNAGAESTMSGVRWGFHGEASVRKWRVITHEPGLLQAWVSLDSVPFDVRRTIEVSGDVIRVQDAVTNRSGRQQRALWGHHPAFGGALTDGDARLVTNATIATIDIGVTRWPEGAEPFGAWPEVGGRDVSLVPLHDGTGSLFYLSGFPETARAALMSATSATAVELRWSSKDFPCAWIWQESSREDMPPFFGRARTCAIEPMSTFPALGAQETAARGGAFVTLDGGATMVKAVSLCLHTMPWAPMTEGAAA